jgi:hypothetical protein
VENKLKLGFYDLNYPNLDFLAIIDDLNLLQWMSCCLFVFFKKKTQGHLLELRKSSIITRIYRYIEGIFYWYLDFQSVSMKFTDGHIDGNNLLEILSSVICVLSMSSLVISHYLFDHKTPMSQIQIKFHQFTNKYNFRKF